MQICYLLLLSIGSILHRLKEHDFDVQINTRILDKHLLSVNFNVKNIL